MFTKAIPIKLNESLKENNTKNQTWHCHSEDPKWGSAYCPLSYWRCSRKKNISYPLLKRLYLRNVLCFLPSPAAVNSKGNVSRRRSKERQFQVPQESCSTEVRLLICFMTRQCVVRGQTFPKCNTYTTVLQLRTQAFGRPKNQSAFILW